jgi:hypothetical protein
VDLKPFFTVAGAGSVAKEAESAMQIQSLPLFAPGRSREAARAATAPFRLPERGKPVCGGPASIAALASLATLLGIQEVVPDATERRRRAIRRGDDLLTELGRLQLATLEGGDPAACLRHLRTILAERATVTDDPMLAHVLEEIEVRVAVEVTKRERPE